MSASSVSVQQIHPAVLREALKVAGGDRRRLQFTPDGRVVILDQPRPGTGGLVRKRIRPSAVSDDVRSPTSTTTVVDRTHDDQLPAAVQFSPHALDRCREFSIAPGTVCLIVERPDVRRAGGDGRHVLVADAVPEWAVVVEPHRYIAGVQYVVTVVRRTAHRWEH